MLFVIVFGLLSLYLIFLAIVLQPTAWLLLWPALSFAILAAAFAGLGARVFGKRATGEMAWWSTALLLPYLLLAWGVWHLWRWRTSEDCCNEVCPGLWVGRKPLRGDLPEGAGCIVDLTSEFARCRAVIEGRKYYCLPILDRFVPLKKELLDLIERLSKEKGGIYIHCAMGHGRSAMVAAALIIARGLADNPEDAIQRIKAARPGIKLNAAQRKLLESLSMDHSVAL